MRLVIFLTLFTAVLQAQSTDTLPPFQPAGIQEQQRALKAQLVEVRSLFFDVNNYDLCMQKARSAYARLLKQQDRMWIEESDALMFIGSCFRQRSMLDSASFYYQKGLTVLRENGLAQHPKVAEIYNHVGNMFLNYKISGRKTIDTLLSSLRLLQNNAYEINYDYIADGAGLLSTAYRNEGDADSAFIALQLLEQAVGHLPPTHVYHMSIKADRAEYYLRSGNYEQALLSAEEGIQYWKAHMDGKESIFYAELLGKKSAIYAQMGDVQKAIIWAKVVRQVYERIHFDRFELGSIHLLWQLYKRIGDRKNATKTFEEYETLATKLMKGRPAWQTIILHDKGVNATNEEAWNDAKYYLLLADSLASIYYPALRSDIQYSLSATYVKLGQKEQALQSALRCLDLRANSPSGVKAWALFRIGYIYESMDSLFRAQQYADQVFQLVKNEESDRSIISLLVYDAHLYWKSYLQTGDTVWIGKTLDILSAAEKKIDQRFRAYYEKDSKLEIQELKTDALLLFVRIQFELFKNDKDPRYLKNAYRKIAQIKDAVLMEGIRQQYALYFSGIPPALAERHDFLRKQVNFYEKQRFELPKQASQGLISRLDRKIFELSAARDRLRDSLQTQFPEYEKIQYGQDALTLEDIQQKVLKDTSQTLLEYFTGDSVLYIFAIRQDTFAAVEVKMKDGPSLDSLVQQLRYGLTEYHLKNARSAVLLKETAEKYAAAAHALYRKLIEPVESLLKQKVIVIPEGILGYVPFDVLLTKKPANATRFYSHSYLGNEKQISYCYSAALLKEMQDKKHKTIPTETLLALAPFFRGNADTLRSRVDEKIEASAVRLNRDAVASLPASGQEVKDICQLFNGKPFYGLQSSKEILMNEAGRFGILHLSTHGHADDQVGEYAWLAFSYPGDTLSFEKFYVKDIYNLSLNADLVTLSACETGIGALKRGEGIISLARAFAYAGAKSIVTTLWPVNDNSTSELMLLFYKNLKNGMGKEEALWLAKKEFIRANKDKGNSHPFFWAGFIPIGDTQKIRK